jgi:hypothetical protein
VSIHHAATAANCHVGSWLQQWKCGWDEPTTHSTASRVLGWLIILAVVVVVAVAVRTKRSRNRWPTRADYIPTTRARTRIRR